MGVNKKEAQLRQMQQTILQAREGMECREDINHGSNLDRSKFGSIEHHSGLSSNILFLFVEDDSGSEHDWEEQQIRKGAHLSISRSQHPNGSGQAGVNNQVTDMEVEDIHHGSIGQPTMRIIPASGELPPITMEDIIKRLRSK